MGGVLFQEVKIAHIVGCLTGEDIGIDGEDLGRKAADFLSEVLQAGLCGTLKVEGCEVVEPDGFEKRGLVGIGRLSERFD